MVFSIGYNVYVIKGLKFHAWNFEHKKSGDLMYVRWRCSKNGKCLAMTALLAIDSNIEQVKEEYVRKAKRQMLYIYWPDKYDPFS